MRMDVSFQDETLRIDSGFQNVIQGPPGPPGESAGFGIPTATIDENVGTPGVTITASGPDTEKVFDFAFTNLKGEPGINGVDGVDGADGVSAGFGTPTATVDSNVGTPAVTVTASGPDTEKVFAFVFSNLKGETGSAGHGVASGGSAGDVLIKSSSADYDTEWSDVLDTKQNKLVVKTVNISASTTDADIGYIAGDSDIKANMKIIKSVVENYAYQLKRWTVTFTDGGLTVNGRASAATTLTLILMEG